MSPDQGKVGEELANFGVGEDETEDGVQMLNGCERQLDFIDQKVRPADLVANPLRFCPFQRFEKDQPSLMPSLSTLPGMPHELLEELVGVLFANRIASGLDDVPRVLGEFPAL